MVTKEEIHSFRESVVGGFYTFDLDINEVSQVEILRVKAKTKLMIDALRQYLELLGVVEGEYISNLHKEHADLSQDQYAF